MNSAIYFLDLFGTAVFALTGALAARKKEMDLFGVIVLAIVTAVGGGTLRDLIIGAIPVFWVSNPIYIGISVTSALLCVAAARFFDLDNSLLTFSDALGLGVFAIVGTQKALLYGVAPGIAIVMGIMTAVVGGMIRDLLSSEIPLVLRKEIYATAAFCGATSYCLILHATNRQEPAIIVSGIITLGLRLSAIKWNISLPVYAQQKTAEQDKPAARPDKEYK